MVFSYSSGSSTRFIKKMLSVAVLGEHQNGPLEAFVYFLREIGVNLGDFVIPEPGHLHPYILDHFEALNNQIFKKYDVLVVFRKQRVVQ